MGEIPILFLNRTYTTKWTVGINTALRVNLIKDLIYNLIMPHNTPIHVFIWRGEPRPRYMGFGFKDPMATSLLSLNPGSTPVGTLVIHGTFKCSLHHHCTPPTG